MEQPPSPGPQMPQATHYKVPIELMNEILTLIGELPSKVAFGTLKKIEGCQPLFDRGEVAPQDPAPPGDGGSTTDED